MHRRALLKLKDGELSAEDAVKPYAEVAKILQREVRSSRGQLQYGGPVDTSDEPECTSFMAL